MKVNRLILILLLSVAVLSTAIFQRIRVESENKVVDVILDYTEMSDMAAQSDKELGWWFSKFKEFNIQYVGLHEETIESMINDNKDIETIMGWELLQSSSLRERYFGNLEGAIDYDEIHVHDLILSIESKDDFDFIYKGLNSRYDKKEFKVLSEGDQYVILLKGTIHDSVYLPIQVLSDVEGKGVTVYKQKPYTSKLVKLGLGFDPKKIETIKESGLEVLPRPSNYRSWTTDQYIQALFDDFEAYKMVPPIFIFTGDAMLGYPDYNYLVAEYMQNNDIKVGLIESTVQRGHIDQKEVETLARGLEYKAVRVFSIPSYIQERYKIYNYEGAEEIENTLNRAVTERNIRAIYFKPFKEDKVNYVTDYKEYENMFQRFGSRIAKHGMTIGRSSTMDSNRVRIAKQTLIGWGVVAGGILLLSSLIIVPKKMENILLVLGMLIVPAGYVVSTSLMEKVMALAASIIFPSLALVWLLHQCRKHFSGDGKPSLFNTIFIAAKDLLITTGISMLGGFFVGGILSHSDYLLEMDLFRGVKISQMLPIAIYLLIYMAYFGYKNKNKLKNRPSLKLEELKSLLFEDIKIIYVLVGAILLVVGYIYIARTGHETSIQPPTIELILRNILEEKFLARPRTKEFLMGFPALMVAIYFARRRMRLFVLLAGLASVIGQTSVVNTFSHLRTPVYLSFARTIYSLALGLLLGIVYIFVVEMAFKIFNLLEGRVEKGRNG